jgi:translation initiation factor IF-1
MKPFIRQYIQHQIMVKNTQGGNKSKGFARKNMSSSHDKRVLRLPSCTLEQIAVVTQLLGHGMFYVVTEEGVQLLGRIRNKFRGRSKRDNNLTKGIVVLVGLREWEKPNYKECDLLEVYDPNEIKQLRKIPTVNMRSLDKHIESAGGAIAESAETEDIEFTTDHAEEYTDFLIPEKSEDSTKAPIDDIIDFDEL